MGSPGFQTTFFSPGAKIFGAVFYAGFRLKTGLPNRALLDLKPLYITCLIFLLVTNMFRLIVIVTHFNSVCVFPLVQI